MSCTGVKASIQVAGAGSTANLSRIRQATTAEVARAGGLNLKNPVRMQERVSSHCFASSSVRAVRVASGLGVTRSWIVARARGSLSRNAWFSVARVLSCPMVTLLPPVAVAVPRGLAENPNPYQIAVPTTAPPRMPATQNVDRRRSGMVASLRRPEPCPVSTPSSRDLSSEPESARSIGKVELAVILPRIPSPSARRIRNESTRQEVGRCRRKEADRSLASAMKRARPAPSVRDLRSGLGIRLRLDLSRKKSCSFPAILPRRRGRLDLTAVCDLAQ